jgi:hypothetical protein
VTAADQKAQAWAAAGVIEAILEDDKQRPAKQRNTAKRIFEQLKDEHGFTGLHDRDGLRAVGGVSDPQFRNSG